MGAHKYKPLTVMFELGGKIGINKGEGGMGIWVDAAKQWRRQSMKLDTGRSCLQRGYGSSHRCFCARVVVNPVVIDCSRL